MGQFLEKCLSPWTYHRRTTAFCTKSVCSQIHRILRRRKFERRPRYSMQQISNRPRSCNLTTHYFSSYRQTKVNLLREQSEGYTKLTLELSNSMGLARDPIRAESSSADADGNLKTRAAQAWQKLVTITGYFDLDPVRVLDIILDAFSSHVVTHWAFFLQLLHRSPWKREPLPRRAEQSSSPNPHNYCDMTFDEILATAEGVSPSSIPEDVNTCANLLGFKFKYYQVCSNIFLAVIFSHPCRNSTSRYQPPSCSWPPCL